MKKILVVGIILILTCTRTISLRASQTQNVSPEKKVVDSVTISHSPANGLHWNGYTIAKYPVPLFIHLTGGVLTIIYFNITGDNISRVEIWVGPYVQMEVSTPPYILCITGTYILPFSHSPTFTTKVFVDNGSMIEDNYTVYRWF